MRSGSTETCHRTAVVSERRQEKQRVVMSTQTGGARDSSVSEGILVWTAASKFCRFEFFVFEFFVFGFCFFSFFFLVF